MNRSNLNAVLNDVKGVTAERAVGRITAIRNNSVLVAGLGGYARLADQVCLHRGSQIAVHGEVVAMSDDLVTVLPRGSVEGVALGDKATLGSALELYPHESWVGRVIDPFGDPLDDLHLIKGQKPMPLQRQAPPAVHRRALGPRLETGFVLFNTLLPIVQGQRLGVFAGSGVGKTTLLGELAQRVDADVVVFALVGERGREIRHFTEMCLGEDGMRRSVIVAATSDQSALHRRQCAFTAMTVAEFFRDQGKSVLYFADSVTRLAEAHRQVALAAGEPPALRGHPPTMVPVITSLCERAGTGTGHQGDITAIFSVLVAGSDFDEPVADTLRGVLDGHIVLDREIAESGRYPAVDVVRSISRSLPEAASQLENAQIARARKLISLYERSKTMITAGLYTEGSDRSLDEAVRIITDLNDLMSRTESKNIDNSFVKLQTILRNAITRPGEKTSLH